MSNYKSYFYKSLGLKEDQIPGGKGDETEPTHISPEQLEMGIKVEMEHTKDPSLAREIAMDHLTEDPQYYSHLKDAGLDDSSPSTPNESNAPMMQKLISPTAIMPTPVIAVGVRGTKTGLLPAGGIVNDPEKARLGGLELVKNLKPNSQGAIANTPASETIKADGGHYTPDNKEISKGDAPVTNVKGDDTIHPMQVQQLGNKPFEDDGTTRDGEHTPSSAGGDDKEECCSPEDISGKGPWGIDMDDEEEEEGEDVSIDIKEAVDPSMPQVKEGWAMGEYTPEQQQALGILAKKGYREVSTFPDQPDAENQGTTPAVIVVVQKKNGPVRSSCEVDPQGLCNGQPVNQFLAGQMEECGTMKSRFQQLANIQPTDEAGALSELRELVGRLNKKGKVTPLLAKAQKYLESQGNV